jgi:hypothetical protein
MNILRFKAPALVELVTPGVTSGLFTTVLTRDVKVINAFAFGGEGTGVGATFQVYTSYSGARHNITGAAPLVTNEMHHVAVLTASEMVLRTGWTLGIDVQGSAQANVYVWVIPLPKMV